MIVYEFSSEKSGDFFRRHSPQFPTVSGFGHTEEEAYLDFWDKVQREYNRIIQAGEKFPTPLSHEDMERRKTNPQKKQAWTENFSHVLTMYLHTAMLERNISRQELARLMALTSDEVSPDGWDLKKTRKMNPKNPPKYKKLQRLLDIQHDSTFREMSEAFRLLNYQIDINIVSDDFGDPVSVVQL